MSFFALNQEQEQYINTQRQNWLSNANNQAYKPIAATLFEKVDELVLTMRDNLVVAENLSSIVSNESLADQVVSFPTTSSDFNVSRSMAGDETKYNQVSFQDGTKVIIPILETGFSYGWRDGLALHKQPEIMIQNGSEASRALAEDIESLLMFGDDKLNIAGAKAGGLMNGALEHTVTKNVSDVATTGSEVLMEVIKMANVLYGQNLKGKQFTLYIDQATSLNWMRDYATGYPKSILERIRETNLFSEILVVPNLPVEMVMFFKNKQCIEIKRSMAPTATQMSRPEHDSPIATKLWSATSGVVVKTDSKGHKGVVKSKKV